eukprot:25002-Eustigmatos_ZCMA.PRE.1
MWMTGTCVRPASALWRIGSWMRRFACPRPRLMTSRLQPVAMSLRRTGRSTCRCRWRVVTC